MQSKANHNSKWGNIALNGSAALQPSAHAGSLSRQQAGRSLLKLGALLALAASGCFAQSITFVQGGKTGYKELKAESCAAETNTASHLLLAAVYAASNSVTIGVSDTMGNTWTALPADTSANGQIKLFYAIAKSTGSNTISATQTSSAGSFGLFCSEWSGNATSGVVDTQTAANASSQTASMSSGNLATTGSSDLLYCVFADKNNGAMTIGSGFTQDEIDTGFGALSEYKKNLAAGSYSCNATDTGSSTYWLAYAAAFKASGSSSSSLKVSAISPASGTTAGGTVVTITGAGFVSGATVTLGGTAASKVTVVSSTTITATTPAHATGAANVVVTDSSGSGTFTNGFTYAAAGAAFGFVQVASATPQTPEAGVTVSYPQAQTAGNLNLVVVGWNDTSATVHSVTDSLGNTYSLAVGPTKGTALTQSIYYAKNILGGKNSVSVTFSQAAAYPDIRVLEYSGISATSPLDVTAGESGASANNTVVSSGSATTSSANELVFGAGTTSWGFTKAGSGFSADTLTGDGNIAEHEVVSAAGTYSASATLGASGSAKWVFQMATFKLAGASIVSTPPPAQYTVNLSWKASSSANIVGYNVYRTTISGGYYGLVGSTTGTLSFADNTVQAGITYYYVTTAVNNQGMDSAYSNQVIATVP